jgi:hypothetical protein
MQLIIKKIDVVTRTWEFIYHLILNKVQISTHFEENLYTSLAKVKNDNVLYFIFTHDHLVIYEDRNSITAPF